MTDKTHKFLSLGAGVQSSTIFLMCCYGELEPIDAAVFADTMWEPKVVYKWLDFLISEGNKHGIKIHKVQSGNIRDDALISQVRGIKSKGQRKWMAMPLFTDNPDGSVGMIRRQCTSEYKIRPLEKKFRLLAGYKKYQRIPPGSIEVWKGISMDEANRASISDKKWITFYYPLIEKRMRRSDCRYWFTKRGLPQPPRSACLGCTYHSNREWRKIRDESPDEWRDVVAFDKAIRKCGGKRSDVFLHHDRIPLDEVNLDRDSSQLSLFSDECMGVCGV